MSNFLEVKEYIKKFYAKNEGYIIPLGKFLLALLLLLTLNAKMGYMKQIDSVVIVLVAALFCSFMPVPVIAVVSSIFLLLHFYALSFECAIVVFALLILMYLLFIRLVPRESLIILLTPLAFAFKIPYIIPIAVGLLGGPISIISVTIGVIIAFLVEYTETQLSVTSMSAETMVGKFRFVLDGIVENDAMLVVVASFAITVVVVYFIRKSSLDYAWTVAIVAGILTDIVILLVGDLLFDLEYSVFGVILGSIVAAAIAYVIQFFAFHMDYSRTEKVQFEDDEYYYYVKAVPKITVSKSDKKVKKINTNHGKETLISKGNVSESHKRVSTVKTSHGVARTRNEKHSIENK